MGKLLLKMGIDSLEMDNNFILPALFVSAVKIRAAPGNGAALFTISRFDKQAGPYKLLRPD